MTANTAKCPYCGETINEENPLSVDSGFCLACSRFCEICEENLNPVDMYDDDVVYGFTLRRGQRRDLQRPVDVCEDCARSHVVTCDGCSASIITNGSFADPGHVRVGCRDYCGDCADDHVVTCDECYNTCLIDDACVHNNTTLCRDCYEQAPQAIHEYHAEWEVKKQGNPTNGRWFGIEIESEQVLARDLDDVAFGIRDRAGDLLGDIQSDSSLNCGFEIITQPLSLDVAESALRAGGTLNDALRYAYHQGQRGDRKTCGLHVHVSRAALSEAVIARLDLFFNNTDLTDLTRRSSKYAVTTPRKRVCAEQKDRYRVLNTTNEHTVEWRAPKGSVNPHTILATIQLLDLAIDFVQSVSYTSLFDDLQYRFSDYVCNAQGHKEAKEYVNRAYGVRQYSARGREITRSTRGRAFVAA